MVDTERHEYTLTEALLEVKSQAKAKFSESVDFSLHLGIDPKQSTQNVRGVSQLPHGSGKTVRVAVFAAGDQAQAAQEAGADRVGAQDLADEMAKGQLDYDVVIATPDMMAIVGKLGPVLGPRQLMPNPKVGTVNADAAAAVRQAKAGQVTFRNDKAGIVHGRIGHVGFEVDQLQANLLQVVRDVVRIKPADAKGAFLQRLYVNSTMGRAFKIELASLEL